MFVFFLFFVFVSCDTAVNIDNTVGAIGFVSRIIPSVYPISIIRADQNTGEPIRGPDGLCQVRIHIFDIWYIQSNGSTIRFDFLSTKFRQNDQL